MEVGDGFAAIRAVVDDDAETVVEIEFAGQLRGDEEAVSEGGFVMGESFAEAWDGFAGDYEDVNGGLRINVADGDAFVVLVFEGGGDLAGDDFFEERLGVHLELR